jgi:mannose-6-phosphate isomerase-like protein (cupin superfamily)
MQVTRIDSSESYDAPRHFGMRGYKVQGADVERFPATVGVSVFDPGGGAEMSASTFDRVYLVASGRIVVSMESGDESLAECDSCFIPAGERRAIRNQGVLPAILVTVIPKAVPEYP